MQNHCVRCGVLYAVAAIGLRTHTFTCADNQIGAEGAKEVAQSLQVNSALSSLNLECMFCCLRL